jgi:hypothetical protein
MAKEEKEEDGKSEGYPGTQFGHLPVVHELHGE